jgi:hypothetical protein
MSVGLATEAGLARALERAASILMSAYVLRPGQAITGALERAAERGARVEVALERAPYEGPGSGDALQRLNAATGAALRAHGVAVRFVGPDEPSVHLKAAVVDGVAYLNDRNWPDAGRDTLVRDDEPRDVACVAATIRGDTPAAASGTLAVDKAAAVRLEAATIAAASGDRIDVESESFGYSPVSKALYDQALHGAHVRILVDAREFRRPGNAVERAALARLARAGADVRLGSGDEKLCATGGEAWVGSANASYAGRPQADWGVRIRDPGGAAAVEAAFARGWAASVPAFREFPGRA